MSDDVTGPSVTSQTTLLSQHEQPLTIDQTLSQTTFSTFGVSDGPSKAAGDHDNNNVNNFIEKKGVEKTSSYDKDGLEESHSSFSTFNVLPANHFL